MDDIQGTAAVLNATKEYEELAHELTDEVAQVFVANEINKVETAAKVTPSDIGSFIKVTKILRKGTVDIQAAAEKARAQARVAARDIMTALKDPQPTAEVDKPTVNEEEEATS
ncbi:TPA: hypothetical protein VDU83_002588 [Pseudomonas aeruginosa]|nr:hypothetical protein [Pseudomonas aeruginosa]